MIKRTLLIVSATILLTGSILQPVFAGKGNREGNKTPEAVTLTATETQGLLFMKEEEKILNQSKWRSNEK